MRNSVNVLGTEYTIDYMSENDNELLKGCDGYCDWTSHHIVIEKEMIGNLEDMDAYCRKVLRHEIVHAFAIESGLHECSHSTESWANNEEMVDWLARLGQKIYKAWEEAGALDV